MTFRVGKFTAISDFQCPLRDVPHFLLGPPDNTCLAKTFGIPILARIALKLTET